MSQNKSAMRRQRYFKALSLCLASLCLACACSSGAAFAQTNDTGSQQISLIDLSPTPAAEMLAAARRAYRQGAVIRIVGGTPEDLQRLLGAGAFTAREDPTDSPSSAQPATPQPQQIVAVRIGANGALHEFVHFTGSLDPDAWQSDFQSWMDNETAESAGTPAALQAPPANTAVWTLLQEIRMSGSDPENNRFQNTATIYRLNDISSAGDWYMVVTQPQSQPDFKARTCSTHFTSCGWWTGQRTISMTTTPPAEELADHGPTGTITSETAGFTVGASLGFTGGGLSAAYQTSWTQPSVRTLDRTDIRSGIPQWQENFSGQNAFRTNQPPNTSIGTFYSNQAAIFQFPEGTTQFQLRVRVFVRSEYYSGDFWGGGPTHEDQYYTLEGTVTPPLFAVDPPSLKIPAGSAAGVQLTARIPASSQGLTWNLTNLPGWLTASQLTGSAPARVALTVAPNTPTGSVASLNFNTDPPFAAPSVETGPLLVGVQVGQPQGTGLLVVGGVNAGNGTLLPLSSAQFVQPQVTAANPMQGPRMNHTATLLQNGQLLVAGGTSQTDGGTLATAEIFDPQTGFFSPTSGLMTTSRVGHTATLLNNGQVLITGGFAQGNFLQTGTPALASAELYDPSTGTFTPTASMTAPRANHTATLLQNGDVLIAGGQSGQGAVNTAEIYHTATGTFSPAGPMMAARAYHTSTLLANGQVLLAGGIGAAGATAELYNPATNRFSPTGSLNQGRALHTATLLSDGQVLLTGGGGGPSINNLRALATAELYNPDSQQFTLVSKGAACPGSPGCMMTGRLTHTATLLPGGTVFIAGGMTADLSTSFGSTEIYNPASMSFSPGPAIAPRGRHTATLIEQAQATISLHSSKNPSHVGESVTFTAALNSTRATGSVTFKDGSTVLGTGTVQNGQAVFSTANLAVGSHVISAEYGGDNGFSEASSSLTQSVDKLSTSTSLYSSLNPSEHGQPVTFTAVVAGAGATGTVTFTRAGLLLETMPLINGHAAYTTSSLASGSQTILASYSGDGQYAGSDSPGLTQTVHGAAVNVTLVSSANPSNFGDSVTLTVHVASAGAGPAPTGTVMFREGENPLGLPVPLENGTAAFTLATLAAGTHSISAVYSGDAAYAGGASPAFSQTIKPAPTAALLSSNLNPSAYGQEVTFTAGVSTARSELRSQLAGTVQLYDGNNLLGTQPYSNGGATFRISSLAQGTHMMEARFHSTNPNFADNISNTLTQTVTGKVLVRPTVTLTVQPGTGVVGELVAFTATVSYPGGPVPTGSITISDSLDGNIRYGAANLDAHGVGVVQYSAFPAGHYNLLATYGGDDGVYYEGAQSNTVAVVIQSQVEQPTLAIDAAMGASGETPQPVLLTVRNPGAAEDAAITLSQISLRTLSGSGEATLVSPVPIVVGSLAPGESRTVTVLVQVPATVRKLALTENGSFQTGAATYQFSEGQVVIQPAP